MKTPSTCPHQDLCTCSSLCPQLPRPPQVLFAWLAPAFSPSWDGPPNTSTALIKLAPSCCLSAPCTLSRQSHSPPWTVSSLRTDLDYLFAAWNGAWHTVGAQCTCRMQTGLSFSRRSSRLEPQTFCRPAVCSERRPRWQSQG